MERFDGEEYKTGRLFLEHKGKNIYKILKNDCEMQYWLREARGDDFNVRDLPVPHGLGLVRNELDNDDIVRCYVRNAIDDGVKLLHDPDEESNEIKSLIESVSDLLKDLSLAQVKLEEKVCASAGISSAYITMMEIILKDPISSLYSFNRILKRAVEKDLIKHVNGCGHMLSSTTIQGSSYGSWWELGEKGVEVMNAIRLGNLEYERPSVRLGLYEISSPKG